MLTEFAQLQMRILKTTNCLKLLLWIFQGTVVTFYKWGGQICNLTAFGCGIFSRFRVPKIIKFGSFWV